MSCVNIPYRANAFDNRIYVDVRLSNHIKEDKIFECRALVDTGATKSAFTPRAVEKLDLEDIEEPVIVECVVGEIVVDLYHAELAIPEIGFVRKGIRIMGLNEGRKNHDAILGMDILSQSTFNFENNIFTLCIN